jgi:hypothetical protein
MTSSSKAIIPPEVGVLCPLQMFNVGKVKDALTSIVPTSHPLILPSISLPVLQIFHLMEGLKIPDQSGRVNILRPGEEILGMPLGVINTRCVPHP